MRIKITRIDKELPLPTYQTEGSVAFDMYSRVAAEIRPGESVLLPSNLIIEVPKGHALLLVARSSLSKKKGLMLANSVGVIDQDYHGSKDEVGILVRNFTSNAAQVEKGERIAQGIIIPVVKAEWEEVESISLESRGGFGSTGL